MITTSTPPNGWREAAEQIEQERIQRRAYDLYELRGKADGRDLDDWLRAESELTQKKPKTAAA
jgi:hypothetical protein